MKTVAVILAAGNGTRFGGNTPKQFLLLNGIPVIEYSLKAFQKNPSVDEILIVTSGDNVEKTKHIAGTKYSKLTAVIEGGKERSDSTLCALNHITEECNVLFHDAARPLVTQETINGCIEKLQSFNAVTAAVKTTDTILVAAQGTIDHIPDRNTLYNCQTPQGFKSSLLKKAYHKAKADSAFKATDDCGVIRQYFPDEKIALTEGSACNMKITYRDDIEILKSYLKEEIK